MLFNSLDFALFFPLVFILYWWVFNRNLMIQNALLLVSSYVFYAWWDWRFLGLIILSTVIDYGVALRMIKTPLKYKRKLLLLVSLIVNLGLLGIFKYYNFFITSWVEAWEMIGITMSVSTLNIILPVGISFYTFQTLSYTIDVYRKQIQPTSNFIQFAAYVSFFPQLVAGPIERAKNLLPQFSKARFFDSDSANLGMSLIVWGLFKKVVVADNCAFFVNQIFDGSGSYSSMELLLGAILFGFQIYGDFSGYSDIAIGVARLFGFKLMINFSFPYFSRDIAEFWRRWHISLSTWFRDYVYIPLGGSHGSLYQQIRNVSLVFLVSGFWHGANWTFIIWGAIHALLFLPLLIRKKNRKHVENLQMKWSQVLKISLTFLTVSLAWIFFRADTVVIAWNMVMDILWFDSFVISVFFKTSKSILISVIIVFSIFVMLIYEVLAIKKSEKSVFLSTYSLIFIGVLIVLMGVFKNPSDFIYFQF